MSQQMRGLVESLLELARVDAGRAQDAQTELDLSALVNEALLPFEPVLFEAGHTLTARVEDGIRVRGNAHSCGRSWRSCWTTPANTPSRAAGCC